MFRYNSKNEFNVPYGGMAYNKVNFKEKIIYLKNKNLIIFLKKAEIFTLDFEKFLNRFHFNENDFIFLDPPYDSEFSTYATNEFSKQDQIRLANFLKRTYAKFMVVIKETDFIKDLYKKSGFKIRSVDKRYMVNFKNRNKKNVRHLKITNY